MGFTVAFSFASADGQRTTTYYHVSKESFLEMQSALRLELNEFIPGSRRKKAIDAWK